MVSLFDILFYLFSRLAVRNKKKIFRRKFFPLNHFFVALTHNELESVFSRNFIVYGSKIILLMLQTCCQIDESRLFYVR